MVGVGDVRGGGVSLPHIHTPDQIVVNRDSQWITGHTTRDKSLKLTSLSVRKPCLPLLVFYWSFLPPNVLNEEWGELSEFYFCGFPTYSKKLLVRPSPWHPCCTPGDSRHTKPLPGRHHDHQAGCPITLINTCMSRILITTHTRGTIKIAGFFLAQNILLLQATQYLLFRHDFSMLHCSFAFQVCLSREIDENTVRFLDELETFWKKTQKNTLKKYIEYSYLANPGVIYWFSSTYWINSRTPVTWSSRLTPFQEPLSRNLEKHGFYK